MFKFIWCYCITTGESLGEIGVYTKTRLTLPKLQHSQASSLLWNEKEIRSLSSYGMEALLKGLYFGSIEYHIDHRNTDQALALCLRSLPVEAQYTLILRSQSKICWLRYNTPRRLTWGESASAGGLRAALAVSGQMCSLASNLNCLSLLKQWHHYHK